MEALLSVNADQWKDEMESVGEYLRRYGDRLPAELLAAQAAVLKALNAAD
jgi:GTP-dependent phosphoenolpyruvate carboxykinase